MATAINVAFFGGNNNERIKIISAIMYQGNVDMQLQSIRSNIPFEYATYRASANNSTMIMHDVVGLSGSYRRIYSDWNTLTNTERFLIDMHKNGGLDLIMLCMDNKSRITKETEVDYSAMVGNLGKNKVPVMLVVTGCENDVHIEKFKNDNEHILEDIYKFDFCNIICLALPNIGRIVTKDIASHLWMQSFMILKRELLERAYKVSIANTQNKATWVVDTLVSIWNSGREEKIGFLQNKIRYIRMYTKITLIALKKWFHCNPYAS